MLKFDCIRRYLKTEKLGKGAYGDVYKCQDVTTKQMLAMKMIKVDCPLGGIPPTALREITLLRQLKHANIVRLHNVIMEQSALALVFELMDMDLKSLMDGVKGPLDRDLARSYAAQMLEAIAYCHAENVMHR